MTKTKTKRLLYIFAWIMAILALYAVVSYVVTVVVISGYFKRQEPAKYSFYLYYEDIAENYPRELLRFSSGENQLQGYLYGAGNSAGLIVQAHGFGSCANGYTAETKYFVDHGYQVFSYDNTGCDKSEGENMVGLCQGVLDLDAALTYIEGESRFSGLPVFLYGHSWGGYAVSAIFHFQHNITASASLAGFSYPQEVIMDWGKDLVGSFVYSIYPATAVYQHILFGKNAKINAVDAINSTDTPILLLHGTQDTSVDFDSSATVNHRDALTNPNVKVWIIDTEKKNDHSHLNKDLDAVCYMEQLNERLDAMKKQYDGEIPEDVAEHFYASVDKERASKLDENVMQTILDFYQAAIQN